MYRDAVAHLRCPEQRRVLRVPTTILSSKARSEIPQRIARPMARLGTSRSSTSPILVPPASARVLVVTASSFVSRMERGDSRGTVADEVNTWPTLDLVHANGVICDRALASAEPRSVLNRAVGDMIAAARSEKPVTG